MPETDLFAQGIQGAVGDVIKQQGFNNTDYSPKKSSVHPKHYRSRF
jgi:hypothetical protein